MSGVDWSHRPHLGELFQLHYHWLCDRLRRHLEGPESAEDIASETFLQLLASPNIVPIREPRALLTTLAQRLIYQRWRRRGLERQWLDELASQDDARSPSPEHLVTTLQTLDRIERRLNRLSPKIKNTFLLSRSVGLTYPEIATRLGISSRSVSDYMQIAETCCLRAGLE